MALRPPWCFLADEREPPRNLAFVTSAGSGCTAEIYKWGAWSRTQPSEPLRPPLHSLHVRPRLGGRMGFLKGRVICLDRKSEEVRQGAVPEAWTMTSPGPLLFYFMLLTQPLPCKRHEQGWRDVWQRQSSLHLRGIVPSAQCSHLEFAPPPDCRGAEILIPLQQGERWNRRGVG